MSDSGDTAKRLIDEKERDRLIQEISKIKETLDSFKYGLTFEDFAEEMFKIIDRQTLAVRKLESKMTDIIDRMERLEKRLNEGIKIRMAGGAQETVGSSAVGSGVQIEERELPAKPISEKESATKAAREFLVKEVEELKAKIARLFEKENDLLEMALNDPAGAEEYDQKAKVVRDMRKGLETRLKTVEDQLKRK